MQILRGANAMHGACGYLKDAYALMITQGIIVRRTGIKLSFDPIISGYHIYGRRNKIGTVNKEIYAYSRRRRYRILFAYLGFRSGSWKVRMDPSRLRRKQSSMKSLKEASII
jgi:hypothetical protein